MKGDRRPWTGKERDRLKALRAAGRTWAECASLLGRTEAGVRRRGGAFGLWRPTAGKTAERRKRVRRLHARGYSPYRMIGPLRPLGGTIGTLYRDHKVLGLTPHALPPAKRGRRGQAVARKRYGHCTGAEYRLRQRVAAFQDGWPAVSPGAVRHLDAFYRLGPATATAHARRLGRDREVSSRSLWLLKRDGHLAVVSRGKWNAAVFDLAAAVRDRRRQVLAYRSDDIPA